MKRDIEKELILSCLRTFVNEGGAFPDRLPPSSSLATLDWDFIVEKATGHKILPFLALVFQKRVMLSLLAPKIRISFEAGLGRAALENLVKKKEFEQLNQIFLSKGVSVIALKGIALTTLIYGGAPIRQMADIDLLVRKEDLERIETLLISRGFRLKPGLNRWQTEITNPYLGRATYMKGDLDLDLQWEPRFLIHKEWFQWNTGLSWRRALSSPVLGKNVFILSGPDQARYLLCQIANDQETGIPHVIQFLDLARVIQHYRLEPSEILSDSEMLPQSEPARQVLNQILRTTRECFLEGIPLKDFSEETKERIESFFGGPLTPHELFGGLSFFKMPTSPFEKIVFLLGYLFPSPIDGEANGGGRLLSALKTYVQHWRRLLEKLYRLTLQNKTAPKP